MNKITRNQRGISLESRRSVDYISTCAATEASIPQTSRSRKIDVVSKLKGK